MSAESKKTLRIPNIVGDWQRCRSLAIAVVIKLEFRHEREGGSTLRCQRLRAINRINKKIAHSLALKLTP